MAYDPSNPRMLFIGAPRPFPAHGPQASPVIPTPVGPGGLYYCKPTSSGTGDGSSFANAAAFDQNALNAAGVGSVVVLQGSGDPTNPTIYRCCVIAGSYTNEYGLLTDQVIIGDGLGVELRGSVLIGNGHISTWTTAEQSGTWTITLGTETAYLTSDGGYQSGGYGTAGGAFPALTYPEDLFWNGVWLDRVAVGATLEAGQWTGDPSTGILIVYPPTAVNPNTVVTELSTYQNFGVVVQSNGAGDRGKLTNLVFNQMSGSRQYCQVDLVASAGGSDTLSDNSLGTGKGWTIEYCEFKYCHSGAVFAGSYSIVQYNTFHDIGQQAIKGFNESPTVRYNEIYNINQPRSPSGAQWDNTNEAGVGKFSNCHAPVFEFNWCHDIYGPGPWTDYSFTDGVIRWNTFENLDDQCVRVEFSKGWEVAYNLVKNTARIYTGEELDNQSSQALGLFQAEDGDCHHNMILNGAAGSGGIFVASQTRSCVWVGGSADNGALGDGTELYYTDGNLSNLKVHDNVVQLGSGYGHSGLNVTPTADFDATGGTLHANLASSGNVTVIIDQASPAVRYPIDQNLMSDASTYPVLGIDSEYLIGTSSTVITVSGSQITYTNMARAAWSSSAAAHTAGATVVAPNPMTSISAIEAIEALSIFDHNVYIIPSGQQAENPNDGGTNVFADYTKPFRGTGATAGSGVYAYTAHRYYGPANWQANNGQDAHSVFALTGGGNY